MKSLFKKDDTSFWKMKKSRANKQQKALLQENLKIGQGL